MEVSKELNIVLEGKHDKPIVADLIFKDDGKPKPIVIFCHGYKGFKDWGAWDKMGERIAEQGFFFLKFNFSHNGTDPENLTEFLNIEAFGDNNYVKELDDLQSVLDWILLPDFKFATQIKPDDINLIGHSRGGGIVTIKAAEDKRVTKLITLASVSDYGSRFPEGKKLETWEKKGVQYIVNTRTGRQLPHHYQFYKNFRENKERLNIKRAAKKLQIPHLIAHGSSDTSVSIGEAGNLFEWSPAPKLLLVENADHVFGISHPWNGEELPKEFNHVITKSIDFLKADSKELWDEYGDSNDD
ncbi:alpha/beta hydrolase family protein [Christiangramia echinicola]|uniref:Alpha/beta hydrolase family protein n=1 Tax=Christiangramia echinicola TaxID=279359 RepID=A0A1H1MTF8_9FLAO|nr:alpha/beta fold hydrolase [Christiangramia echinicola]SDR89956.1 Alpha/beta hydrolase family protein [Christiangramia echinicola]